MTWIEVFVIVTSVWSWIFTFLSMAEMGSLRAKINSGDSDRLKLRDSYKWMEGIIADRILKLDASPQEEQPLLPKGELVEVVRHYKNPVFSDGWKEIRELSKRGDKASISAYDRPRTIKEVNDFLTGVDPVLVAARIHLDKPCEETHKALDASLKNIGIMQSTRV